MYIKTGIFKTLDALRVIAVSRNIDKLNQYVVQSAETKNVCGKHR